MLRTGLSIFAARTDKSAFLLHVPDAVDTTQRE